jgi:hypothetical protein
LMRKMCSKRLRSSSHSTSARPVYAAAARRSAPRVGAATNASAAALVHSLTDTSLRTIFCVCVCASRFRSPAVLKMLEYYIGARARHTRRAGSARHGESSCARDGQLSTRSLIILIRSFRSPFFSAAGGARDKVYIVTELLCGGARHTLARLLAAANRCLQRLHACAPVTLMPPFTPASWRVAGELLEALLERGSYSERDARTIFKPARLAACVCVRIMMRARACTALTPIATPCLLPRRFWRAWRTCTTSTSRTATSRHALHIHPHTHPCHATHASPCHR